MPSHPFLDDTARARMRAAAALATGLAALTACAGPAARDDAESVRAAEAAMAYGTPEEALAWWMQAIEEQGGRQVRPYAEATRILIEAHDLDGARALIDDGLLRHPDQPALLVLRGDVLASQGFHRAAEADFQAATRAAPFDCEAWRRLGRARLALDLPAAAVQPLRQALALGDDSCGARLDLARALRDTHDPVGAGVMFAEAVSACDRDGVPGLCVEAARLWTDPELEHDASGRARALGWLEQELRADPQDAEASFWKGRLLELAGDPAGALACYRRAVEVDGFHVHAHAHLARLYFEQGDPARAQEFLERALSLARDETQREAIRATVESGRLQTRAAKPISPSSRAADLPHGTG